MIDHSRNTSVSIAKGLAIILVVLGHSWVNSAIESFVLMFHVPAFFLLSGYCFKDKHLQNPKGYYVKKIRGIYFPYVKYSILFLLLHNLFFKLNIYNDASVGYLGRSAQLYSIHDVLLRAFKIVTGLHGHDELLGAFWFLPELLYGLLIFYCLIYVLGHDKIYFVSLVCFILALIMKHYSFHVPHIGIDANSFLAACFISLGYWAKKAKVNPNIYLSVLILLFLGVLSLAGYSISMNNYTCKNAFIFVLYAIGGGYSIWSVSSVFKESGFISKLLVFAGDNSIYILTFHFLAFKLVSLLIIKLYHLPIYLLASFPTIIEFSQNGWFIIYCLVGVFIPLGYAFLKLKVTRWTSIQH